MTLSIYFLSIVIRIIFYQSFWQWTPTWSVLNMTEEKKQDMVDAVINSADNEIKINIDKLILLTNEYNQMNSTINKWNSIIKIGEKIRLSLNKNDAHELTKQLIELQKITQLMHVLLKGNDENK